MGEKTVTLSAYTAERLEEYRKLNDKYEKLAKEVHGIELPQLGNDHVLIRRALSVAINYISNNIIELESIKEKEGAQHDT